MLLRWKWKGEKKGEKRSREREKDTRERIIYHSRLPNNTKEKSTTCIHIPEVPTSYKSVQSSIQIYRRYPPSYLLPPRYHTNPSIQYTHHKTLLQHLHLVSSIIIIPYNKTYKKYLVHTFPSPTSMNKPPGWLASCSLPYLHLSDNKYRSNTKYAYISSTIENYLDTYLTQRIQISRSCGVACCRLYVVRLVCTRLGILR